MARRSQDWSVGRAKEKAIRAMGVKEFGAKIHMTEANVQRAIKAPQPNARDAERAARSI